MNYSIYHAYCALLLGVVLCFPFCLNAEVGDRASGKGLNDSLEVGFGGKFQLLPRIETARGLIPPLRFSADPSGDSILLLYVVPSPLQQNYAREKELLLLRYSSAQSGVLTIGYFDIWKYFQDPEINLAIVWADEQDIERQLEFDEIVVTLREGRRNAVVAIHSDGQSVISVNYSLRTVEVQE